MQKCVCVRLRRSVVSSTRVGDECDERNRKISLSFSPYLAKAHSNQIMYYIIISSLLRLPFSLLLIFCAVGFVDTFCFLVEMKNARNKWICFSFCSFFFALPLSIIFSWRVFSLENLKRKSLFATLDLRAFLRQRFFMCPPHLADVQVENLFAERISLNIANAGEHGK